MAMRDGVGLLVGILLTSLAGTLSAAASDVPVQVRFEAPATCPDRAVFWREITARSDRIRESADDAAASQFDVTIVEADGSYQGTLAVRRPNAAPTQRRVIDVTCAELVSALALIAALTVDPEAGARGDAEPPATTVEVPAGAPRKPERGPPPTAQPPPEPLGTPSVASPWSVALGTQLELIGWLAPEPMLGSRWFWELGRRDGAVFRTSFSRSAHSDARAQLVWATARLEACPLALGQGLRFRPCGGLDAGLLLGTGASSPGVRGLSFWKRWIAADLLGRLYVPVLGALELQADAGLVFPLARDRFVIEGATSGAVHDVPSVGGFAALGLGLRFGL